MPRTAAEPNPKSNPGLSDRRRQANDIRIGPDRAAGSSPGCAKRKNAVTCHRGLRSGLQSGGRGSGSMARMCRSSLGHVEYGLRWGWAVTPYQVSLRAWQCLTVLPACPVPRPGFLNVPRVRLGIAYSAPHHNSFFHEGVSISRVVVVVFGTPPND